MGLLPDELHIFPNAIISPIIDLPFSTQTPNQPHTKKKIKKDLIINLKLQRPINEPTLPIPDLPPSPLTPLQRIRNLLTGQPMDAPLPSIQQNRKYDLSPRVDLGHIFSVYLVYSNSRIFVSICETKP